MLKNYFIVGCRNLLRNKVFSLINIFGLAVGLAACILIVLYVRFEFSYDRFHKNSDRVYRVILEGKSLSAANHPGVGPALKADFPEVDEYVRMAHLSIFSGNNAAVSYEDEAGNVKVFNEERLYDVDPSFFKIFTFPFVYGDPATALSDIQSVVISETLSNKFFGVENPLGKTLLLYGHFRFNVSGVFRDIPDNSHIKFDILIATMMKSQWQGDYSNENLWKWPEFYTYIKLDSLANPQNLEAKFSAFMKKYLGKRMTEMPFNERIYLQPLVDIHLKSPKLTKEREAQGSEQMVYFLLLVAILILITVWVNFINLSTAKSIDRAQEVGLRKVVGASRRQVITYFLFESAIINFLAIILSFILVLIVIPYFNELTGKNIDLGNLELAWWRDRWFWCILVGVFICGSSYASLYPAVVLSSFKVAAVLNGKFFKSASGIISRKILVGTQFAISIALMSGTIMVFRQVSFMRTQELGYVKNQLLVVKSPLVVIDTSFHLRLESYKTELRRNSNIQSITTSSEIPAKMISQLNSIRNKNEDAAANSVAYQFYVSKDFIETFGFDLIVGRTFREDECLPPLNKPSTHPVPVMVNKKVIESLGYKKLEDAIDKLVIYGLGSGEWVGEIIGVVGDHHQRSLRESYDPIIFFPVTKPTPFLSGQYITMNINMQQPSETILFIKEQYAKAFPGNAFEYFFLDEYVDRLYASDQQFGRVFGIFSSIAFIVAALGLFGLSTFLVSQRSKEIAIRKVLGATLSNVVYLFSRDFVILVIIATFIAQPLVYILVDNWLSSFAFRIPIELVMMCLAPTILLIISLLTVSFQTIKTGSTSPIKSLKSD